MSRDKDRRPRGHTPSLRPDGYWICQGGHPDALCGYKTREYHEAVNHATEHRAWPPDPPRGWAWA